MTLQPFVLGRSSPHLTARVGSERIRHGHSVTPEQPPGVRTGAYGSFLPRGAGRRRVGRKKPDRWRRGMRQRSGCGQG